MGQQQFCRYTATVDTIELTFWATADGEDIGPQGRRIDASIGAQRASEPITLPSELFTAQDTGECLRCGNVWESVPALLESLRPVLDRLLAAPVPPQILELGAGMGLPGLWAAARGADVVLTDFNLPVLELLSRNARLLGIVGDGAPTVRELDWSTLPGWACDDFDLVIASDVLYNRAAIEPFVRIVAMALRPGGILLISHTERDIFSFDEAIDCAESECLRWTAQSGGGDSGSVAVHTFEKDF